MDWPIESLINALSMMAASALGAWATIRAERVKSEKRRQVNLHEHEEKVEEVEQLCQLIGEKFGAIRCDYWVGHNGTISNSGFHLMNITMIAEWHNEKTSSNINTSKNVPVSEFKRNMGLLKNSKTGYIVTHESTMGDQLALTIQSYGVFTFCAFKTCSSPGIWDGMMTIGFEEEFKELSLEDLAWMKLQANRIPNILGKDYKVKKEVE